MSARQLQDSEFVPAVVDALTASGLDPRWRILEMTESIMIGNPEAILVTLNQLREIGVRLAIDDFGTGCSGLSYLERFPIDILKIDRSFIDGIGSGTDNSDLARAVIALGATRRVRTIAEGVGNAEQVAELQSLGCELSQGCFFAKPLAPQDIGVLFRERLPLGAGENVLI